MKSRVPLEICRDHLKNMVVMDIFNIYMFHRFQLLLPKFMKSDFESLKNKDKLYIQIGLKPDLSYLTSEKERVCLEVNKERQTIRLRNIQR